MTNNEHHYHHYLSSSNTKRIKIIRGEAQTNEQTKISSFFLLLQCVVLCFTNRNSFRGFHLEFHWFIDDQSDDELKSLRFSLRFEMNQRKDFIASIDKIRSLIRDEKQIKIKVI